MSRDTDPGYPFGRGRYAELRSARLELLLRRISATPAGRALLRIGRGLFEVQLVDRALALGSQIFTSVLPVIIAASVFTGWHAAGAAITDQFGFHAEDLAGSVREEATERSLAAFGVVGSVMVVLSGTSFARALGLIVGSAAVIKALSLDESAIGRLLRGAG